MAYTYTIYIPVQICYIFTNDKCNTLSYLQRYKLLAVGQIAHFYTNKVKCQNNFTKVQKIKWTNLTNVAMLTTQNYWKTKKNLNDYEINEKYYYNLT